MSTSNSEAPVLDSYQAVVSAYCDFLTVAIHTILFERKIYPEHSFIKARKYNFPVRQSRHPKVCSWIQDAVAAVESEMLRCSVADTSLILYSPPPKSAPLERYVFSTANFPRVPQSELQTLFAPPANTEEKAPDQPQEKSQHPQDKKIYHPPPTSNLPEQFRATLARLTPAMGRLKALPEDCSFTLAIALRDDKAVEAPLRRGEEGSQWIAAEPRLQKRSGDAAEAQAEDTTGQTEFEGRKPLGRDLGGVRTTPVRSLEAGAFAMEVWVEEAKGKFVAQVEDEGPEDKDGEDGEQVIEEMVP